MSDERQWLTVALDRGAKIDCTPSGLFVCLGESPDSFLFHAFFLTPEMAARAYCREHGARWPDTAATPQAAERARQLTEMAPDKAATMREGYEAALADAKAALEAFRRADDMQARGFGAMDHKRTEAKARLAACVAALETLGAP